MSSLGTQGFKIMYGTKPPSITFKFSRLGTEAGEAFTFYDYDLARKFIYEANDAFKAAWHNADLQGVTR